MISDFESRYYRYSISSKIHDGDTADIFNGLAKSKSKSNDIEVIVKIPHSSSDNDLIQREALTLRDIEQAIAKFNVSDVDSSKKKDKSEKPWGFGRNIIIDDPEGIREKIAAHFPQLLESIKLNDTIETRVINVFQVSTKYNSRWYSLEELLKRYPDGVDTRHAVWIWNRILEAMTFYHNIGLAHGAITPNHILIHPESHAGMIIDWTDFCKLGENVPYLDDKYQMFYPPEFNRVGNKSNDVYMAAKNILYILGGDVQTLNIKQIEKPLLRVLNKALQVNQRLRYSFAEKNHDELRIAAEECFGKPSFAELRM